MDDVTPGGFYEGSPKPMPPAAELRKEWEATKPNIEEGLRLTKEFISAMTDLSNKAYAEHQMNASAIMGMAVVGMARFADQVQYSIFKTEQIIEEQERKESQGDVPHLQVQESVELSAPIEDFLSRLAKKKGLADKDSEES